MTAAVGGPAYSRLAAVYDDIVVDRCHDRWAAYLTRLWCTDRSGVRSVLDVCCGTGLMTAALREHGYRVAGVDSSEAMLELARSRLGQDVPLFRQTLPELCVAGPFDAVVSTFDGLNYLSIPDLRATIAAVGDVLRPGGWLVFDLHSAAMMEFTVCNPVVRGESHGMSFVITSEVDLAARTCDTRIDLTRLGDGDAFSETHRQFFISDDEVRSALADNGFLTVRVTDEYTDEAVDDVTLRATWIARKPGPR